MFRKFFSVVSALLLILSLSNPALANGYKVSFNKANIGEFIDTASVILGKTILVDPNLKGTVTVRSYSELDQQQYYELFLSVLEMNGFSVIELNNGLLKVVKNNQIKQNLFAGGKRNTPADSLVTMVVPVDHVPSKELAPLLRQMNASYGTVATFNPSNILIITGRASNVQKLVEMVQRIDRIGAKSVVVVPLQQTSAKEMTRILTSIYLKKSSSGADSSVVVANEKGNQVIISGSAEMVSRMRKLAQTLDSERAASKGKEKVFYLRYAKAESLKEVLDNVASISSGSKSGSKNYSITAHEENNALIVTADPDLMQSLASLIEQLDIRRAQVMVEAIIAEVSDDDGINLSLQLANLDGSIVQFNDGKTVPAGTILSSLNKYNTSGDSSNFTDNVINKLNGAAISVSKGNWGALLQAVATAKASNILSTPSLLTLDNESASFVVGDEVPTITGSTSGDNNSNPYQTIERRQIGVKLEVTPQINEGDAVRLDIRQEVSKVNGSTPVDVTFSTREVETSVMVRSGDTVVISGMMDDDVQESQSKVPLLGDIPWIGHLFRSTSTKALKRNLMVFIRPTIIRDDDMMQTISANKYSLIRAAQLKRDDDGVDLMPSRQTPILPKLQVQPAATRPAPKPAVTPVSQIAQTTTVAATQSETAPVQVQTAPVAVAKKTPKYRQQRLYHTVVKGNTLYAISKHYGTTVEKLKRLNGLTSNTLEIDQVLLVDSHMVAVKGDH